MNICLDVDGVLADFVGGTARLLGFDPTLVTMWDYYPQVGQTEESFWRAVDAAGADFWANLEPYPWERELFDACNQMGNTILLTTPSTSPTSPEGKLRWIQEQYGKDFRKYLIGPAKEFCANPNTVLIDDSESNCAKFRSYGGHAILFPRPWNYHRTMSDPLAYTLETLDMIVGSVDGSKLAA
jgi:5'(3')-deoxyribonucleotidase